MSRITRSEVEYIAGLARLQLSEEEVEGMTRDLEKILDHVAALEELDTSDIEPTAHAIALATPLREDESTAGMDPELALANAPKRAGTAFGVGEKTSDPMTMCLSDVYTVSDNLAGIPGLSLPCGRVDGMPCGLQLLGRALDEATLLRVADAYQRRTDHHRQWPQGLSEDSNRRLSPHPSAHRSPVCGDGFGPR